MQYNQFLMYYMYVSFTKVRFKASNAMTQILQTFDLAVSQTTEWAHGQNKSIFQAYPLRYFSCSIGLQPKKALI